MLRIKKIAYILQTDIFINTCKCSSSNTMDSFPRDSLPSPFHSEQKQNTPSKSTLACRVMETWFKSMKRNAVWLREKGTEQKVAFNGGGVAERRGWRQINTKISFWKAGIFLQAWASCQQIPTAQSPTGEGQCFPMGPWARTVSPFCPAQAHLQNKGMSPPSNTLHQWHWFPTGRDLRTPPSPGEPPCLSTLESKMPSSTPQWSRN